MNWTILLQIAQALTNYGSTFAALLQDILNIINGGGTPVVTSKSGAMQRVKKATVGCCPDDCCEQVDKYHLPPNQSPRGLVRVPLLVRQAGRSERRLTDPPFRSWSPRLWEPGEGVIGIRPQRRGLLPFSLLAGSLHPRT